MYAVLWRSLPGHWPVRAALALVLVAVVVGALFTWGFPALAPHMPFNDSTVQ